MNGADANKVQGNASVSAGCNLARRGWSVRGLVPSLAKMPIQA